MEKILRSFKFPDVAPTILKRQALGNTVFPTPGSRAGRVIFGFPERMRITFLIRISASQGQACGSGPAPQSGVFFPRIIGGSGCQM